MSKPLTTNEYTELISLLDAFIEAGGPSATIGSAGNMISRLTEIRNEQAQREAEVADNLARRSQAVPVEVPNFRNVRTGTLVRRSENYIRETYDRPGAVPAAKQVGLITEIKYFKDDISGTSCWPVVHWEGDHCGNLNHPLNVAIADGTELPTIVMNANQRAE